MGIHWPHTGRWGPGVMAAFEMADMLAESLHKGRPKDEEPHVKRAPPKKGNESGIEYIVRVDLEELGIEESDEFEELQTLFQLFDRDKDGILNLKEFQGIARCLGLHPNYDQAMELAATVSADTSGFSVSFNEYLKLVSNERKADPDEAALLNMFRSLDTDDNGFVLEEDLRKLMTGKAGITNEDIEEMIEEYKKLDVKTKKSNENISEDVIFYQDFVAMLQS